MPSPANAAVVRPSVSERSHWILKHHGVFQGFYWFHHVGADPDTLRWGRGAQHSVWDLRDPGPTWHLATWRLRNGARSG